MSDCYSVPSFEMFPGETLIICTALLCCVCIHLAVLGMTFVKLHPGHGVLRGHWKNEVILNMTPLQITLEQGVLSVSSGEGKLCNTNRGKVPSGELSLGIHTGCRKYLSLSNHSINSH